MEWDQNILFGCPKRKENEKTKPKWPCLGVL